jgi:PilZ domain
VRSYIRHPSDIPIDYQIDNERDAPGHEHLKDVGIGGLSFFSARDLSPGTPLTIRVTSVEPAFSARARVVWCRPENQGYLVGVAFIDAEDLFQMRMVEQLCHIEHYRAEVLADEGRQLNGEQAAREWIGKFARGFPAVED